jgi:acetyl esterase
MGDSAGGNIAIAVTLMSKFNNGPKIKYQILAYPATNSDKNSQSYNDFKDGPSLNGRIMEFFLESYLGDLNKKDDIFVSPLKSTNEQLSNLPNALIITAENDPLRDDGEAYAHKLMQANVDVYAIRIIGSIHGFLTIESLKQSPSYKSTINLIINQIKNIINN